MDPLTTLYKRLHQAAQNQSTRNESTRNESSQSGMGPANLPDEPPQLEDWLRYWNDEDTDLGNLRNFEHWLALHTTVNGMASHQR
jgi:hypothetical protein